MKLQPHALVVSPEPLSPSSSRRASISTRPNARTVQSVSSEQVRRPIYREGGGLMASL